MLTRICSIECGICPIAELNVIKYTALIYWYFWILIILSLSLTLVENFNLLRCISSNFIFVYIDNNYQRTLILKVYLKSSWYVKLCKWLHLANYDITISTLHIRNTGYAEVFCFEFTAKNMKLYTFFNSVRIAATEKRPLNNKTSQSFHRPRYCGVQTLPLKMHYGGEKLGKIGVGMVGFWPPAKGFLLLGFRSVV